MKILSVFLILSVFSNVSAFHYPPPLNYYNDRDSTEENSEKVLEEEVDHEIDSIRHAVFQALRQKFNVSPLKILRKREMNVKITVNGEESLQLFFPKLKVSRLMK